VLVGGEPGIGKSRLVREFKERLNRHTMFIATSACREFAQRPLDPIEQILAQIASIGADDLAGSSKQEHLDLIAGAFERVVAKRTAVAIIEDLHWAALELMQTLLLLTRNAANKRLLFVGTYRDNEMSPAHPLFKWFGQLVREPAVSVIGLRRFEQRELDRLMELATSGVAPLSAAALHAVRDRSDGNPLFAEELLRSAVDSQRAGGPAAAELPLSLHALVEERLNGCGDDQRSFLRYASLFGRDFALSQVCEVFGSSAALVQPMVDALCDLQLLDPVDTARGAYRFRHALTRDAVYREMPETVAKPLHVSIAEHLEIAESAAPDPLAPAHHFWHAGEPGRAAPFYERAGDGAMAIFAYDDAAGFYERAAEGYGCDDLACARVCARAARASIFAGDLDGGLALYDRAVGMLLRIGAIAEVVRHRALMAGHLFDAGMRSAAVALIRETLPIAQPEPALEAQLRTRLAMTLARDARVDEARKELSRIDAAALNPDMEMTGEYHLCASELHALRGELDAWQASFALGLAVYEALGHPGPVHVAHANFAVQALCVGETQRARDHHRLASELARTLRLDDQIILLAQVELYAGNLLGAQRIVEPLPTPRKFLMRALLAQVALPLAVAIGHEAMLRKHLDDELLSDRGSQPLTPTLARVAAAHALALAAVNRGYAARTLLERVLGSLTTPFGMALPVFAIATIMPERARELRPMLEKAAEPQRDRLNKALLALVDATQSKVTALEAARRFGEIGWPLFEARCLELADERDAARAIYLRCGAAGDVRRLEFAVTPGAARRLGVLTARERELALQVAAGKANRAVAEALSIGEKTVEKYLTSIYAKLGLTSRAQLVALVAASRERSQRAL